MLRTIVRLREMNYQLSITERERSEQAADGLQSPFEAVPLVQEKIDLPELKDQQRSIKHL